MKIPWGILRPDAAWPDRAFRPSGTHQVLRAVDLRALVVGRVALLLRVGRPARAPEHKARSVGPHEGERVIST
jgi:hypothetical protein